MEQITVKPGHKVKVNTQEEWAEVRGLLVKAGAGGNRVTGQWYGKNPYTRLAWSVGTGDVAWDGTGTLLEEITLHQLRHATNVVTSEQQALINKGFTLWFGGECPVEPDTLVDIVMLDGERHLGQEVDGSHWQHESLGSDIIAYRVHEQQEEDGEDANGLDEATADSEATYLADREDAMRDAAAAAPADALERERSAKAKLTQAKQLLLEAATTLNCSVHVEYEASGKDLTVEITRVIVERY